MIIQDLEKKRLINPPSWLADNVAYLVMSGSVSYGVSSDTSDMDLVGFCVPRKNIVFPHLSGYVPQFGSAPKLFEQWIQHGVKDGSAAGGKGKEYDLTVFNICKYFDLCFNSNPNAIDYLFVPEFCVLHITAVGQIVRDNRKKFLNKGCWPAFKGYSYAQLKKATNTGPNDDDVIEIREYETAFSIPHDTTYEDVKHEMFARENPEAKSNLIFDRLDDASLNIYLKMFEKGLAKSLRFEARKINNLDLKFVYNIVRLILEVEQILTEHDLDLQRGREQLKAIRAGNWSFVQIQDFFDSKVKQLEEVYHKSTLPYKADEDEIKKLLLACLEQHWGSIDKSCIVMPDVASKTIKEIVRLLRDSERAGLELE